MVFHHPIPYNENVWLGVFPSEHRLFEKTGGKQDDSNSRFKERTKERGKA